MNCVTFVFVQVTIEPSWKKALGNEFSKPYFESLVDFVKSEYSKHPESVFPKGNQIFRAFDACPLDEVKVVILGQDPYPTKGHAHGLCFSCEPHVRPLPKSLKNIYKELQSDLGIEIPEDGLGAILRRPAVSTSRYLIVAQAGRSAR